MSKGVSGNWVRIDPFAGLDVSVKTSNVISTRNAFDLTLSWYTTAGSLSTVTYQISNASGNPHYSILGSGLTPSTLGIPEASWSNWTAIVSAAKGAWGSGATNIDPPLGYRWARLLDNASGASYQFEFNRLER